MQCEDCKFRNECLNFGIEEIKEKSSSCTDYVCESPMPTHTHPIFRPLFRSRDNAMDRSSNDVLSNIDNSAR